MSRRSSLCVAVLASACAGLYPAAAEAQTKTFTVDRIYVAGAPDDGLGIWRPEMGGTTRLFGQFGLGLAINPLRSDNFVDDLNKEETLEGHPLTSQFIGYFNAGAQIKDRLSLQASFPLIFYQSGNPTTNNPVDERLQLKPKQAVDLKPVAPMDLRLEARVLVFRNEPKTFKLGILGAVYIPTGNKFSFAGDGKVGALFGLGAEYDAKKYVAALNVGVRIRPFANLHELNVSHEFTYGLGGYIPIQQDRIRVGLELFGATGIDPGRSFPPGATEDAKDQTQNRKNAGDLDTSPLEWNLNGRMFLTKTKQVHVGMGVGSRLDGGYSPDFRAVATIGGFFGVKDTDIQSPGFVYVDDTLDTDRDGIPDNIDMCPNDPEDHKGPNPNDGCPQLPDRDNDGIPDVSDKCPDQAEDFDKVDDRDGCPEDDADKDGIADAVDKCPKEPGESSEEPEKNGCPHYIRRISGSAEIQIMKQVEFKFDSYVLLPVSSLILDEVVRLLQVNPEIKLVSVEGHTDNQGSDAYNDKLSKERAKAVVDYLIKKGGISPTRLTSSGFGSTKPLMTNETDEGRAKNRRVEFHIKSQAIEGR
jgi:outer membrane protein OmpA-like peptidoglycan-associated protein